MTFATLHNPLADAFSEYEAWLLSSEWRGKEHDCVNLFVHRFVYSRIHPAGPLSDFTQVGIEVGVPQPASIGIKQASRKDLVIWDAPAATTWDAEWRAVRYPRAIIEWKARRKRTGQPVLFPYDIEWLRQYSLMFPKFTGYCATVDFTSTNRRVATAHIFQGEIEEDFHRKRPIVEKVWP
jgi:hypothetical protein